MSAPTNPRSIVTPNPLSKVQRQRIAAAIAAKDLLAGSAGLFAGDKAVPDVYDLINLSSWFLHGKDQHSLEEAEKEAAMHTNDFATRMPDLPSVSLPRVKLTDLYTPKHYDEGEPGDE